MSSSLEAIYAIHPNLQKLSYNANVLLEACPRLFELDRLSERREKEDDDKDVHLDFGSLVGSLVQDYLVHKSTTPAIWNAFLSYPRDSFSTEVDEDEKKHKKDFWYALQALDKFVGFKKQVLGDYEVAVVDGKPAVELGFIIDCPGDFQYRGKLDAFLINSREQFACFECKTTGSKTIHEAMFRNSGQGIGYSAIVDVIAGKLGLQERSSFPVWYPVYQTHKYEWEEFKFIKSRITHANWIRHLLRSIQHISEYAEDNFFPMHGQNCFRYNRPCRFFEQCEMSNKFLVGDAPKVKVDKDEDYQFRFSLDELIEAQLEKVRERT